MKIKKVSKKAKRRLILLAPLSIIAILYFFSILFYYGTKLVTLKVEETELNNQLLNLQASEKELKTEIEKLKDPEYLAKYARENYLYSKQGEYVIKIDKKEKEVTDNKQEQKKLEKIVYISGSVFIFMIIFIVVKAIKKSRKQKRKA